MIQDVLAAVQEQLAQGQRAALVTVTETTGSSPASAGQCMAVLADGRTVGSVGGGATEHRLTERAMEALRQGETVFAFSFDHAENGMVCGGGMAGFGHVLGTEAHLYIFGGGHVGQRLAALAAATGFSVTVIEDRPGYARAFSTDVRYLVCSPQEFEDQVRFSGAAYAVICTRGHRTDDEALRFCLAKPLRYVGMIGSRRKVAAVFDTLRRAGFPDADLDKVYTPIGLDIASGVPAEIAVSILAEILLVKNGGSPNHKRLRGNPPAGD